MFADVFEANKCQTVMQGRVKWFEEDQILYIESTDDDYFVVADLENEISYKCIIPGISPGKAGRNRWFRLLD